MVLYEIVGNKNKIIIVYGNFALFKMAIIII